MNLLEFQAKNLLAKSGIAVPRGEVLSEDSSFSELAYPVILKAQVPVGGRGKAGGILKTGSPAELLKNLEKLLTLKIKGHTAAAVLAEEALDIRQEFYLAITVDRTSQQIAIIAHPDGGIDIEAADQDKLVTITDLEHLEPAAKRITKAFGLPQSHEKEVQSLIQNLYDAFKKRDALLIEINPLVLTGKNELVAADAKIILDNAAQFRHPAWSKYSQPESANFVVLDTQGEVAAMANGAGLAMATVDAIAANGLKPANFLDVGGGSSAASMLAAFNQITALPNVKAIIINIFAGITRCDEVAEAIVEAKKQAQVPPLFIRLYGTNRQEGEAILTKAGIIMLGSLDECIMEARHAVSAR